MAEEAKVAPPKDSSSGDGSNNTGKRRRRRRRRRRSGPPGTTEAPPNRSVARRVTEWTDDVLVAEGEDDLDGEPPEREHRGRRGPVEPVGPTVSVPASGRNPYRKRASRARRGSPGSAGARRRRLTRVEVDDLTRYLEKMGEPLVTALYRGLGGQPNRVASPDRMIQLATRAIAQGSRLASLLKQVHERDRKALAALLQSGGIAHADEFHRELMLSFGGHERDWHRTMLVLANRGLVAASPEQDNEFFYIVPEVLVDGLVRELGDELTLSTFSHPDVRVMDSRPFCPPLDFSISTLATFIDQNNPRLTQRHEIYRHDRELMDNFFAQVWEPESELFSFHLQFLMMHGMVELRGEYLALNRDVMEEWLQLEAEDQRDILFRALDERFSMAEWVLWAIHGAGAGAGEGRGPAADPGADTERGWVAERPLVAQYRRWKRGEDWRERFQRGVYGKARTSERESYSFAPLVRAGILELGQWGQEKFYRLSPRGRHLLEPSEDDGFQQFYLTPSFEIMAPAGLAPILLFRIGELGEIMGCDRANTYKITETSIERALERGWRRDDVLQFLRDNSQIGLPENVEQTLKGWIGHRGDVEFHELVLMTVHRSQIRRLESNRKLKPYLLHRFAPGMYAVEPRRREEILGVLQDAGFSPASDLRRYPGDPEQVEARRNLHRLVAEAREAAVDPASRGRSLVQPEHLSSVPGTKASQTAGPDPDLPPEVNAEEVRRIIDHALSGEIDLEMIYLAKTGQRQARRVQPQRLAFKADAPVLVALDREDDTNKTFLLERIERLREVDG